LAALYILVSKTNLVKPQLFAITNLDHRSSPKQ